jgi:hypothetical protein
MVMIGDLHEWISDLNGRPVIEKTRLREVARPEAMFMSSVFRGLYELVDAGLHHADKDRRDDGVADQNIDRGDD